MLIVFKNAFRSPPWSAVSSDHWRSLLSCGTATEVVRRWHFKSNLRQMCLSTVSPRTDWERVSQREVDHSREGAENLWVVMLPPKQSQWRDECCYNRLMRSDYRRLLLRKKDLYQRSNPFVVFVSSFNRGSNIFESFIILLNISSRLNQFREVT